MHDILEGSRVLIKIDTNPDLWVSGWCLKAELCSIDGSRDVYYHVGGDDGFLYSCPDRVMVVIEPNNGGIDG